MGIFKLLFQCEPGPHGFKEVKLIKGRQVQFGYSLLIYDMKGYFSSQLLLLVDLAFFQGYP